MGRSRSPSYSSRSSGSRSRSRSRDSPSPGPRERDSTSTTIFAGNLSQETTDENLRRYFTAFGPVAETQVIIDKETGRSKGYGFVKFTNSRSYDNALAEAGGQLLDGRPLKCSTARSSGGNRGGGYAGRGNFRGGRHGGRFGGERPDYYHGRPDQQRWRRSSSPGRYSPDRYMPPRYHDDGYERGPPMQYGTRQGAPRGRAPPARRPVTPPRSPVYAAAPLSEEEDPRAHERAAVAVAPASLRTDLEKAKLRATQEGSRAAALETEVEHYRTTQQEMQVLLQDTAQRLQASELTCKQYKKWLGVLSEHARALVTTREAVRTAEANNVRREQDLGLYLKEAEAFLATQKREKKRKHADMAPSKEKDGPVKDEVLVEGGYLEGNARPAEGLAAKYARGLASEAGSEDEDAPPSSSKFKPGIKFKLPQ